MVISGSLRQQLPLLSFDSILLMLLRVSLIRLSASSAKSLSGILEQHLDPMHASANNNQDSDKGLNKTPIREGFAKKSNLWTRSSRIYFVMDVLTSCACRAVLLRKNKNQNHHQSPGERQQKGCAGSVSVCLPN